MFQNMADQIVDVQTLATSMIAPCVVGGKIIRRQTVKKSSADAAPARAELGCPGRGHLV
jgi:hypothetical protein